jgi:hypothetical protein
MWRSSIPEAWVKIRGTSGFKHVSETGNNQNTLDFLKTNEKYISSIAIPASKSPSNASAFNSREASRRNSKENSRIIKEDLPIEKESIPSNPMKKNCESSCSQVKPEDLKQETFENAINCLIPDAGKKLLTSTSLKCFQFELNEEAKAEKDYCVNKYSLPKLLVKSKKQQKSHRMFKNRRVNEFLRRFERDIEPSTALTERKGLNGWKLVALRRMI